VWKDQSLWFFCVCSRVVEVAVVVVVIGAVILVVMVVEVL